jgi:hypothetical protein
MIGQLSDHVRENEAVYEDGYEYGRNGEAEQAVAPDGRKPPQVNGRTID